MKYPIEFKPKAVKDLKTIPSETVRQILSRLEEMEDDLKGDVKKLTNHTPEYRLRVGRYRVLFEIEAERIVIYRIKHRREAYQ